MGDHRLPERATLGELENAGKRGPEGRRKNGSGVWHYGDWSNAALDHEVWYSRVCQGGCRFMVARVGEEENASESRQRKGEKRKRRTRLRLHLWGDRSKLETF